MESSASGIIWYQRVLIYVKPNATGIINAITVLMNNLELYRSYQKSKCFSWYKDDISAVADECQAVSLLSQQSFNRHFKEQ